MAHGPHMRIFLKKGLVLVAPSFSATSLIKGVGSIQKDGGTWIQEYFRTESSGVILKSKEGGCLLKNIRPQP